jgi:hypothetical protein
MKLYADKKRYERTFQIGTRVYLKLQPYRHISVQKRGSSNLSSKFYGAFEIIEKVGKIAYKLNLPKGSQVHLVFHVSHLKEKLGTNMIRDGYGPGRAGFMSNPGPEFILFFNA